MDRVKRTVETDRLRSALLTSISHDLKTPLAAILGSAGRAARSLERSSATPRRADLLATIIDESERLNRFIANLLDMTKLESGAIAPNAAPHDLGEIVGSALAPGGKDPGPAQRRAGARGRTCRCSTSMRCCSSRSCSTFSTTRRNTRRPERTIRIQSWRDGDPVALQILTKGEGIPAGDLENIFDKFYRAQKGDQVRAGTGLGLAISRGFVEAMQRHDRRGQPHRSRRRRFHHQAADSGRATRQLDTAA